MVVTGVGPKHGRQSQVWVRFPDAGWKIVSAHVSHKVVPPVGRARPSRRRPPSPRPPPTCCTCPSIPPSKGGVRLRISR